MPQNKISNPTNSDRQSWHRLKRNAWDELCAYQYSVDDEIWAAMGKECRDRGWLLQDGYQRAIESLAEYAWNGHYNNWNADLYAYADDWRPMEAGLRWGNMTQNWEWGLAKNRGRNRRELLLDEPSYNFLIWGREHSATNLYATLIGGHRSTKPARTTVPAGFIIDKAIYFYFGFEQFEVEQEHGRHGAFDARWWYES